MTDEIHKNVTLHKRIHKNNSINVIKNDPPNDTQYIQKSFTDKFPKTQVL